MDKKGFTLIELMVVVGMLGLLAAICIPKMKEIADKAACKENGVADACARVAALEARRNGTPAPAAPVPVAEAPAPAPVVPRDVVRGRVMKVEKVDGSGDKLTQWSGVLSLDNGTAFAFAVNDMVLESTTICIGVSADRNRSDTLVLCK